MFLAKLPSSSQTQPLLARGQLALSKGLRRASTSPASTQQSPSLHLLLSAVVTFTVDYRQRMFCAIFSFTLRFTLQAGAPILILCLVSEIFNLKILLHLNIERVHLRLSDIYPGLTNYPNSLKHQKREEVNDLDLANRALDLISSHLRLAEGLWCMRSGCCARLNMHF